MIATKVQAIRETRLEQVTTPVKTANEIVESWLRGF